MSVERARERKIHPVILAAATATVSYIGAREAFRTLEPVLTFLHKEPINPKPMSIRRESKPLLLDPHKPILLIVGGDSQQLPEGGRKTVSEGLPKENGAVDFHAVQLLKEAGFKVNEHGNFSVSGSTSGDFLNDLRKNEQMRTTLINSTDNVIIAFGTGPNNWREMVENAKGLNNILTLGNIDESSKKKDFIFKIIKAGFPVARLHSKTGRDLQKTYFEILMELKKINKLRLKKGNSPLFAVMPIESANFGEAEAIHWASRTTPDETNVLKLDTEHSKQLARMVSNSVRKYSSRAIRRFQLLYSSPEFPPIIVVRPTDVEKYFNYSGDQHIGSDGQRFVAERLVGELLDRMNNNFEPKARSRRIAA